MTIQHLNTISDAQAYYLQALGVDLYRYNLPESSSSSVTAAESKTQQSQAPQPKIVVPLDTLKQSVLVQDICLSFGVKPSEIEQLSDDYFKLGSLYWRFMPALGKSDGEFKFVDNKLMSIGLDKLSSADVKRGLWQHFAQLLTAKTNPN